MNRAPHDGLKAAIQALSVFAMIASGAASPACSSNAAALEPALDPTSEPAAAAVPSSGTAVEPQDMAEPRETKPSAPVQVTLSASAKSGTVVITLGLTATANIPGAVSRIVLPKGVKLVSGQTEIHIPFLARGAVREHVVTVEVPTTEELTIYAGVDCHISSGVLMHEAAPELILGR